MGAGHKKTQMEKNHASLAHKVSRLRHHSGVFERACSICTICAVETALVMFSAGDEIFCSGDPCVDAVIHRIVHHGESESDAMKNHLAEHEATVHELGKQYSDVLEQLKHEKARGEELRRLGKITRGKGLLDAPVNDLNLEELEILKKFMEELKGKILERIGKHPVQNSDASASSCSNANLGEGSSCGDVRGRVKGRGN